MTPPRYEGIERRVWNGNSDRDYPLWLRAARDFGYPVIVAMVLLGMLTGYVPSPITRTETMITEHVRGEGERMRVLRVMCRRQLSAAGQNPDDCDWASK